MKNKNLIYKAGDLVLARRLSGYDSPHWEWIAGMDYPEEYAIITEVEETDYMDYYRYFVKYIDGTEDVLAIEDLRIVAYGSQGEKISRDDAALPLNED